MHGPPLLALQASRLKREQYLIAIKTERTNEHRDGHAATTKTIGEGSST
jgi:hypothetical protein